VKAFAPERRTEPARCRETTSENNINKKSIIKHWKRTWHALAVLLAVRDAIVAPLGTLLWEHNVASIYESQPLVKAAYMGFKATIREPYDVDVKTWSVCFCCCCCHSPPKLSQRNTAQPATSKQNMRLIVAG
jgi:hypothetical protein